MLDRKLLGKISSEIAGVLREERKKRGLSMNTVAERSGLSQPMIGYVEREQRNPTIDTLLRIAMALEIDLPEVIRRAQNLANRDK